MKLTWPDTLIEIAIIIVVAIIARGVLIRLIRLWIKNASHRAEQRKTAFSGRAARVIAAAGALNTEREAMRSKTLASMLGSVLNALLIVIVVFMILQAIGINIAPALASAGIGGIALGFGAQSLVKDILAGIFLMLEDQYGVGDSIDIGELRGTVLALGLRVTRIQDTQGEIWYVRNGEITTLGNRTQGWSTSYVTLPVAISQDPQQVLGVLTAICTQLENDPKWSDKMLAPPTVLGLSSFEKGQAIYQVMFKSPTDEQWAVERELRARAITAFKAADIRVPSVSEFLAPSQDS